MKSQSDLISIVVPTFNGEKYIKECLDSILVQSYKNIEVVVIIDGSTDSTELILTNYSKKDNRVKVFKQKNQGVSTARNHGIKKATGKYITFVDDDDYISQDYILKMYEACKKNNWDVVKTGFSKFVNDDYTYFKLLDDNEKELNSDLIQNIFETSNAFNSSCMMLINKEILDINNILFNVEIGYAEDFLFTFTLLSKSRKCGWINSCGYNCRVNQNSNSRTGNINKQFKNIKDSIFAYQVLLNGKNDNKVANKILFIVASQLKTISINSVSYKEFIFKLKEVYLDSNFIDIISKFNKNLNSGNMKIFINLLKQKSCVRLYLLLRLYNFLKK